MTARLLWDESSENDMEVKYSFLVRLPASLLSKERHLMVVFVRNFGPCPGKHLIGNANYHFNENSSPQSLRLV